MLDPQLNHNIRGTGEYLVFLHGYLENSCIWNGLADSLEEEFSCITIDLPGHHPLSPISEDETIESIADRVFSLLEELGVISFTILGHSMGGYVALQIASKHPKNVKQVILVNSHADADTDDKKTNRNRLLQIIEEHYHIFTRESIPNLFAEEFRKGNSEIVQMFIESANSLEPKAAAICAKAMRDRPSMINKVKVSCTFIVGSEDDVLPIDEAEAQAREMKAELVVLNGVGHMSFVESPLELEKAVYTSLSKRPD